MKTRSTIRASFRFAWMGLSVLLGRERNSRIELGLALATLGLCFWYRVSTWEWCAVLLCSAGVLSAEAMNSAVEELADALHPKPLPGIGRAKDLAAAAVLIMACASVLVGCSIFGPRLLASVRGL